MFNFKGMMAALSYPLIYLFAVGILIGLTDFSNLYAAILFMFIPSYVLIGILAPYWNPKTPFFASYLASVTFTVINQLGGHYFFGFENLANTESLNRGFLLSTSLSLATTYLYLFVKKRKGMKELKYV